MSAVAVTAAAAVTVISGNGTRREVHLSNVGPNTVYLDTSDGVTDTNGLALPINGLLRLCIGENQTLYARCKAAETADLRYVAF